MPVGPSRCSITAEPARRYDRLQFGEIEIDNRQQGLSCGTVSLVIRQCFQPGTVLYLQARERRDGVVPALDPAEPAPACALGDAHK
jgi:hypothetical protein